MDPNQELQLKNEEKLDLAPETLLESVSKGVRSFIAIVIYIIIPVVWYFDWNASTFADKTSEDVAGFFDDKESASITLEVFSSLPPLLTDFAIAVDGNLVDYASDLKEFDLLESYSSPAVKRSMRME